MTLKRVTWVGDRHRPRPRYRGFRRGVPQLVTKEVADLMIRDHGPDVIVADRLTKVAEHVGVDVERREFEQTTRGEGDERPRWRGPEANAPAYRGTPSHRINFSWSARGATFRPVQYRVYRGTSLDNLQLLTTQDADSARVSVDTTVAGRTTYYYGVSYVDNRGFESEITIAGSATTPTF